MTDHTASLTLVTGGTGKTGRRVAARLQELGVPVRIGSRAADPPFDWERPATWDAALDGARAVYIAFQPDLAVPGADEVIRALTARATAAGVRRLVLLSGRGEPEAEACERIVLSSGMDATVVRASWFLQNFTEGDFAPGVLAGELALPVAPDIAEPFIDADDLADVAVAALTQDGHAGEVYEVTGPRALTFPEVLDEIGRAAGRQVRYQPLTLEQFTGAMAAEGVPQDHLSLFAYLFTEVLDGRNAATTDGVHRALGRAPRDAATWASAAAGLVTTA